MSALFGELFQFIRNGMNIRQDKSGDGLPITRIETIADSSVDPSRVGYARLSELDCASWLMEPGDILFSHINSVEHLGKCAVYRGVPDKLVHGMNLLCLRCNTQRIIPEFAKHLIRSAPFRTRLSSYINKAVNQASVSITNLKSIHVSVPSIDEQHRIAHVLDRAEELRATRRAALAQLDDLIQAIFLDLFGDPATNPKNWPRVHFAELGENQDALRIPVKASDRDGRQGTYPYYGASGAIDWVDEYIFDGDRLLIGEDGANLLARSTPVAFIARGKYWVNNHAHVIAENGKADLRFLEFFIERFDLTPFISGTAQPKLNRSNLDRILVPSPPLPLQRDFARRVAAVEKLKATHRASLAELDALFASLQHRAFRGEL